jgi:hypothetical protein
MLGSSETGSEYIIILGVSKLLREAYFLRLRESTCKETTATRAMPRPSIPNSCPRIDCVADGCPDLTKGPTTARRMKHESGGLVRLAGPSA